MVVNRDASHAYAVLSFGGFLGMGTSYHPLPWNQLTYEPAQGGYVVDSTSGAARDRAVREDLAERQDSAWGPMLGDDTDFYPYAKRLEFAQVLA